MPITSGRSPKEEGSVVSRTCRPSASGVIATRPRPCSAEWKGGRKKSSHRDPEAPPPWARGAISSSLTNIGRRASPRVYPWGKRRPGLQNFGLVVCSVSRDDTVLPYLGEMSRRSKTPSYVAEFPLRTSVREEQELSIRLDAARQIYNASLGESLRRLALLRESKEWQQSRSMPRGPARKEAFQTAARRFGFGSGEIQKFAERCRDGCWIGDHLFSHDTQTTSLRAFRAVQQYAFGKRGHPRFKGKRGLRSVEGKSDAVITFRKDPVPTVHWGGLALRLVLDPRDQDGWEAQALSAPHKYC